MCPPSSVDLEAEIGEYWTDEGIFTSLMNFRNGNPLPSNVTSDVNPYQYQPSDLPANLWYFCSCKTKETECGFWVETGEACEMVSNSIMLGLRTTLQFYEGRAPHGVKTDWLMQEYRITDKLQNDLKDHRALCRVFMADESKPPSGKNIADIDVKISDNLDSNVKNTNLEKTMDNNIDDHFLENSSEMDCILRGDYFELNDLLDSSSSANSSCLTMTSDEYFDSIALLKEIEDDIKDQEMKDSHVNLNLSTPVKPQEVVLCPPTSVSLRNGEECKPCAQKTSKEEDKSENGSKRVNSAASSSNCEGRNKEGKKEDVGRKTKKRKMMKYLCFLAF